MDLVEEKGRLGFNLQTGRQCRFYNLVGGGVPSGRRGGCFKI